jgi:S1-C subfamily serine protease
MPSRKTLDNIQKATVQIVQNGGQGVLVQGNFILTAAHCIEFSCEANMALGDYFIEEISTFRGMIKGTVVAVEPVSDIAVLGPLDGGEALDQMRRFYKFSEEISPVQVCLKNYGLNETFPILVYTHKGKWVSGEAILTFKDGEKLWVEFDEQIEGGTSGSPIINEVGELVGIVSNSSINPGQSKSDGLVPRPHLTLPVWIINMITEEQFNNSTGS